VDLLEALRARQTTRVFEPTEFSRETLSTLLWAANGINRTDGKRTAPSAYDTRCVRIYLATERGFFLYQAEGHRLKWLADKNLKGMLARLNGYAASAPIVLLLTGDISGFPAEENRESQLQLACASAGFVGQNVYLAAAALKLGTVYAAGLDSAEIRKELAMPENEILLALMPVGYPKR
jgi:nitroreductase